LWDIVIIFLKDLKVPFALGINNYYK